MQATEDAIYEGEWVIALSAAGKFLGKLKPDTNAADYPQGLRLEPVYDVLLVQMQGSGGQPQVQRQLMPILLIPVDIGMTLGKETAIVSLRELPEAERQSWFGMVRNVRAGMQQLRAQRAGVIIGMRMLRPHELFAAQGFPDWYKIDVEYGGKPLTIEAQNRLCGNSVSPMVSRALAGANATERMAA